MKVLLDTHTFLWFVLSAPQLSTQARGLLEDGNNAVLVSPASSWEIAIKLSKRKLQLHGSFTEFVVRGIDGNRFEMLPVLLEHCERFSRLPIVHQDPFDRLLVAQAIVESIPLISADSVLDQYGVVRIW